MNTGQLPAVGSGSRRAATRPAPGGPLETTVEELFGAVGGRHWGASPVSGNAVPSLVIDEDGQVAPVGDVLPNGQEGDPGGRTRGARRARLAAERGQVAAAGRRQHARLRVIADTSGARVPLGLLWFFVGAVALGVDPLLVAATFTGVAAVGAIQTGAALRKVGGRAMPLVAGAAVVLVGVAGVAPSSRVVGLCILIALVGSLISALHIGGFDLDAAGDTVRSWLGPALAAASLVVVDRVEPALGMLCFVLVCTYDAGDYLVGTASDNAIEGPLAGVVGVLAVGCAAAVLHPGGLADHGLWPFVFATAIGCPAGQLAGSAMLPHATAFAPGLRRLDSLIVTGPLWMVLLA